MIKNTFTKIGDHLLMCDGVVTNDGVVVKVTSSDKLILSFMHHRWNYFVVEEKQGYWDSLEYIALRTGNNVKTVERCVSKFNKAGVILAEKRFDKKKKHNKWFWLGFSVANYVRLDGDSIKEIISTDMKHYTPKSHYKSEESTEGVVNQEIPEYLLIAPEPDMLIPYSDYDNDFVMSVYGEIL